MATPDVSNASTMHGYRLSSKQNRSGIDFGRCVKENASSAHDAVMEIMLKYLRLIAVNTRWKH
jgi:hypothetical protein